MKNISLQFYLEVTATRTNHRLYARLSKSGVRKKIYSDFLVPEACWLKEENRTIARSNKKEFSNMPRFFAKTSQANDWIKSIELKVKEINDRISRNENFTFDQIVDYVQGITMDIVVPIESELTLKEFFEKSFEHHIYLKKLQGKSLSNNSIDNYGWYIARYLKYVGENTLMIHFDQKLLDKITYQIIDEGKMNNTSIRSMYGILKAIFNKGKLLELMPKSYSYPVFPFIKDSEYKLKTRITVAQIEQLKTYKCYNAIQQQAIDAFLIAFYGCGMRMSEVLLLRMKHINPHMRIFNYYSQKGNETVPYYQMSQDFWNIVSKYYDSNINPETFLMPVMRPYSKHHVRENRNSFLEGKIKSAEQSFNYWYKTISNDLNFPEVFTNHSARKSFALALYEATNDVLRVKEYLNHKKLDTTMVYLARNGVKSIMHKNENIDIFEAFKELSKEETLMQKVRRIN